MHPVYGYNEEKGEWVCEGNRDLGIGLDDAWRVMGLMSAPCLSRRKQRRYIGRSIRNAQKQARLGGVHLSAKQLLRISTGMEVDP